MNLTDKQIDELKSKISNVIINEFNWKLDEEIKLIGSGVINAVFQIKEKNFGLLAVRTPWLPEENMMDQQSSGVISLKKEATIAKHCYKYHLKVPKVHQLYLGSSINFLVSEYMAGDNKPISSCEIGNLINMIHKIPLDGLSIIDQNQQTLSQIIPRRIINRYHTLKEITNLNVALPTLQELEAILDTSQNKNCLLHLDVRRPNLIGVGGSIKSIIDWDNAFIGDPIMELMRISETKELNVEEFLKGYNNNNIIENTDKVIQLIYRLDTALMLSILFTSFIHDTEKREHYINRVRSLSGEIMKSV